MPPPLPNQPPLRVTTKDMGRTLGIPDAPENLQIIADNIPKDLTIEEASIVAEDILRSMANKPEE